MKHEPVRQGRYRGTVLALLLVVLLSALAAAGLIRGRAWSGQYLDDQLSDITFTHQPPNAANTGVPDDVETRVLDSGNVPYSSDAIDGPLFIINTPGAVYDGWEFHQIVEVAAPGVTFSNCIFQGSTQTVDYAALLSIRNDRNGGDDVPSASVANSTFIPRAPNAQTDGVRGSNFTLDRVEIAGTVDGAHIFGTKGTDPYAGNVLITRSWIHDLVHYDDDSHRDGSHNDGVQIVGGSDIAVVASRIDGEIYNAAVMITQDRSPVSDVTLRGNWLASGACSVNIYSKSEMPGMRLTDNSFRKDSQRIHGCDIKVSPAITETVVETGSSWYP